MGRALHGPARRGRLIGAANPRDPQVRDRFVVNHPADLERGTADEHQLRRRRHGQTYTVIGRWANQIVTRVVVHFDADPQHKTISWPLQAMANDTPSDTTIAGRSG